MECKERNEEIRKLRKEGMTFGALAEKYGITRARVEQIVKNPKEVPPFGFSQQTYRSLVRAGLKSDFTLDDLSEAIEYGLRVRNIGAKRVEEISKVLERKVTITTEPRVFKGCGFTLLCRDCYLIFEEEVKADE